MTQIISKASTQQYRRNYDSIDWDDTKPRKRRWVAPVYLDEETPDDGGYDVEADE